MAPPDGYTPRETTSRASAMAVSLLGCVVVALASCPAAQVLPTTTTTTKPPLEGAWQSTCLQLSRHDDAVEAVVLTYGLTSTLWALDVALFDDADCTLPFGTIHTDGGWVLERPSAQIAGAWDIHLDVRSQTVTPHADAFVAFLTSHRCGLEHGVDRISDMFDLACPALGLQPVPSCPTAYDIVIVDGDALRFGERDPRAPRCSESTRPTSGGPPLTAVR
jgi:hypothetical protein